MPVQIEDIRPDSVKVLQPPSTEAMISCCRNQSSPAVFDKVKGEQVLLPSSPGQCACR